MSVSPRPATACFDSTSWLGTLRLGPCRPYLLKLLAVSERQRLTPSEALCHLSQPCRDTLEEPKEEELVEKLHKHPHLHLCR